MITVVTGASSGIGSAIFEHRSRDGGIVVGGSRRSSPPLDVTDDRCVRDFFHYVQKTHGGIDVVINNAGIATMNHSFTTPAKTVDNVLATNVKGTFLVAREAAKIMMERSFGRIINLSTIAVPLALAGEALYVASKAAIESLTRVLAREYAAYGVTVNAIGPAVVPTPLTARVSQEKLDALLAQQAIKRPCEFEDITNAIDFFASKRSGYITGQVLYLGGVW